MPRATEPIREAGLGALGPPASSVTPPSPFLGGRNGRVGLGPWCSAWLLGGPPGALGTTPAQGPAPRGLLRSVGPASYKRPGHCKGSPNGPFPRRPPPPTCRGSNIRLEPSWDETWKWVRQRSCWPRPPLPKQAAALLGSTVGARRRRTRKGPLRLFSFFSLRTLCPNPISTGSCPVGLSSWKEVTAEPTLI